MPKFKMAAKFNPDFNRRKRKSAGGWDSSITDLSVHRLTPAELERRKANHISRNLEAARKDLYEAPKVNQRDANISLLTESTNQEETLSPQKQKQLLIKAKCVKGEPNITLAPHIINNKENLERTLLEAQTNRPTAMSSPGGIHGNTLCRPEESPIVLNEVFEEHQTCDDVATSPKRPHPLYRPLVDVKRYQEFIQQESTDSVATSIQNLRLEMTELEREMGMSDSTHQGNSLESVVKTCTHLVQYLKEAQRQLREERTLQEQLLVTIEEQQGLMDTMATDILQLKEDQIKLNKENRAIRDKYTAFEVKLNELQKRFEVPPQFMPVFLPGPPPPLPHSLSDKPHPPIQTTPTTSSEC